MTGKRAADYFSFLGLTRKLNIDLTELEKRFRDLSRRFHPDYFYNAPAAERRASLEQSSYLNDAYRTLKHPTARVEYLLGLEGLALKGPPDAAQAIPSALVEETFALNEELDEIRELRAGGAPPEQWRARIERAREQIAARSEAHEAQVKELVARWDLLVDGGREEREGRETLRTLRERMLERRYLSNLLAGIESLNLLNP